MFQNLSLKNLNLAPSSLKIKKSAMRYIQYEPKMYEGLSRIAPDLHKEANDKNITVTGKIVKVVAKRALTPGYQRYGVLPEKFIKRQGHLAVEITPKHKFLPNTLLTRIIDRLSNKSIKHSVHCAELVDPGVGPDTYAKALQADLFDVAIEKFNQKKSLFNF